MLLFVQLAAELLTPMSLNGAGDAPADWSVGDLVGIVHGFMGSPDAFGPIVQHHVRLRASSMLRLRGSDFRDRLLRIGDDGVC